MNGASRWLAAWTSVAHASPSSNGRARAPNFLMGLSCEVAAMHVPRRGRIHIYEEKTNQDASARLAPQARDEIRMPTAPWPAR